MRKPLMLLPFLGLALIAAAPAAKPSLPIVAPAEIAANPANRLNIELSSGGTVVVQLRPDAAPNHVYRIQQLASSGFYNGLTFHRVIPGFMAQGGDPEGTGKGGSKLPDVAAEFNSLPHMRGVISMARSENPDSANSQFFIMLAPRMSLDNRYSAFGRVVEGMATVDTIAVGEPPAQPTRIVRATIGGPLPAAPVAAAAPVPEAASAPAPEAAPAPEPAPTSPAEPPAAVVEPAPAPAPEPVPAEQAPVQEAPTPQ